MCCILFTTVHECTHTIPPSSPSFSNEAWIPGFLCRCPLFPRSCIIHHSFLFHAPFTSDGLQGLPFPVLSWPGKPFGWDEERDFHSPRGGGRGWTLAVPRRHSDLGSRGVPRFLGGVGMGSDPSQKGPQRSSPWIGGGCRSTFPPVCFGFLPFRPSHPPGTVSLLCPGRKGRSPGVLLLWDPGTGPESSGASGAPARTSAPWRRKVRIARSTCGGGKGNKQKVDVRTRRWREWTWRKEARRVGRRRRDPKRPLIPSSQKDRWKGESIPF